MSIDVDAMKIARTTRVQVEVKVLRLKQYRFRVWLALKCMNIGMWAATVILPHPMDVHVSNAGKE